MLTPAEVLAGSLAAGPSLNNHNSVAAEQAQRPTGRRLPAVYQKVKPCTYQRSFRAVRSARPRSAAHVTGEEVPRMPNLLPQPKKNQNVATAVRSGVDSRP